MPNIGTLRQSSDNNLASWLIQLPGPRCAKMPDGSTVTASSVFVDYDNLAKAFLAQHNGQYPQRTWQCDGSTGAGANNCTQVDAAHWVQQFAASNGLSITGPYV